MTSVSVNSLAGSTDGLPKQFVTSLRILFDILDEERTGYVRLRDIESRWHEEGVSGLPSGVIDSLRKVAPKNGRLTFDNFVTGLKLSLLKNTDSYGKQDFNQVHKRKDVSRHNTRKSVDVPLQKSDKNRQGAYPSDYVNICPNGQMLPANKVQPNQNVNNAALKSQPKMGSQAVNLTASVRPNNVLQVQPQNIELRNQIFTRDQKQQATVKTHGKVDHQYQTNVERNQNAQLASYHQRHSLGSNPFRNEHHKTHYRPKSSQLDNHQRVKEVNFIDVPTGRPDRPPPYRRPQDKQLEEPPVLPPKDINGRIMNELRNWHKEHKTSPPGQKGTAPTVHSDPVLPDHSPPRNSEIYVNFEQIKKHEASQNSEPPGSGATRKTVRRQNSRRHTLSSGIDYNVIRRMKQLEQEKDVLIQGLEVVERAREWYHKQISKVTEKQHYADKTSCSDVTLQSQQERMDFVRSRITDVNMNLKILMETTESGFPAHMNLAIRSNAFSEDKGTKWLKEQNKQLTQEVGTKSERITQLEKEKASLIRDLFEARSRHKTNYDDTTFM